MALNSKGDKVQVHSYVDANSLKTFKRLYPSCLARFISLVLEKANSDYEFFAQIFFDRKE